VNSNILLSRMYPFVELQRRRLKFAELGHAAWNNLRPGSNRNNAIQFGSRRRERTSRRGIPRANYECSSSPPSPEGVSTNAWARVVAGVTPNELVRRASVWNSSGQAASDYVVANADAARVHALVSSRGSSRPPVWSKAYNALVGLYFGGRNAGSERCVPLISGDDTVDERLAKPVDRSEQLAGNIWFYYGSRFGEYAGVTRQGNPEDFLPALLEQSPASSSGYMTVAD